ncbi:zinc finger protein 205 [Sebastes umbrosus]|uniref:zinc finger protein 205 n=1 Tax=Sebastes umbrosus TaxID=72105 RepID=UPI00189DE5EA|nr:zinc finger protein 205 [Sebastes umbrosus]
MLHRLLLCRLSVLEDEDENAAAIAKETLAALAIEGANDRRDDVEAPGRTRPSPTREEEEEEEERGGGEEEEDKGRKKKRRRVWSECEECGRRFSRMSLLKAHRQTHVAENAAADTSSPSSPPAGSASALRCSDCGKRFSSATRLHSHVRTQHPGTRT